MVRPDDEWFPGLGKIREEFESYSWIYGRTPKFKVILEVLYCLSIYQSLISLIDNRKNF